MEREERDSYHNRKYRRKLHELDKKWQHSPFSLRTFFIISLIVHKR